MDPKTGSEMGCSPKNLIYGRLLGIWAFRYMGFSVVGLLGIGAFGGSRPAMLGMLSKNMCQPGRQVTRTREVCRIDVRADGGYSQ
jgi:hypothetical protein